MILLAYDLETTGLDKQNDRIIEVGMVLYSTGQQRILESTGFLVKPDGVMISEETTELTGITQAAVDKFGYEPEQALEDILAFMSQADAVLGQNVIRFDKRMTESASKRAGLSLSDKPWIDTMTDIPGVKGQELITMCAKVGVLMPSAHGALIDATCTLEMARRHAADPNKSFEKMLERAQSPTVVLRSHQPNTKENNKIVRKHGFIWNSDYKIWWRATKEMDVQEVANKMPFEVSRVDKDVPLEVLQD